MKRRSELGVNAANRRNPLQDYCDSQNLRQDQVRRILTIRRIYAKFTAVRRFIILVPGQAYIKKYN